jgi:hypothetical protein
MERKMKKTSLIVASFALAACATQQHELTSLADERFSTAEVAAFERFDARLNYADAQIAYDGSGCAMYRGIASNGLPRRELLRDAGNRPICDSRRADDFISRWLLDSR